MYDPKICVIMETWLHEFIRDDEILSPDYKLFRKDTGSRDWRVAVIVNNSIEVCFLDHVDNHESLFRKITLSGLTFFLVAVYRLPDWNELFLAKCMVTYSSYTRDIYNREFKLDWC